MNATLQPTSVPESSSSLVRWPWAIAAVVSLGFTGTIELGIYSFRPIDLVLYIAIFVGLRQIIRSEMPRTERAVLSLYIILVLVRIAAEWFSADDEAALKTLLGMGALYLTPVIFFAMRGLAVSRSLVRAIVIAAVPIILLSQFGLLQAGEWYNVASVDLATLVGIQRPILAASYPDNAIAVFRALTVGGSLAVAFAGKNPVLRLVGLVGLLLQFGGGGGSRGGLVLVVILPLVLTAIPSGLDRMRRRLRWVPILSWMFGLIVLFLVAPADISGEVKGTFEKTHLERVSELLLPFTQSWDEIEDQGGLEGRTQDYSLYWRGITGDVATFAFGRGLWRGAAFEDAVNGAAHNAILDLWAAVGFGGLCFWVFFLFVVMKDFRFLASRCAPLGHTDVVGLTCLVALTYLLSFFLSQAVMLDRSFLIVFFLLAGLLRPLADSLGRSAAVKPVLLTPPFRASVVRFTRPEATSGPLI